MYDNLDIVSGDYSYASGIFTINTTGIYVFDWKLSITPNPGTTSIQIDLERVLGPTFEAGISITATNPVTNGCLHVVNATAGDQFELVNNSLGPVSLVLVGLTGPIGTIAIFRLS